VTTTVNMSKKWLKDAYQIIYGEKEEGAVNRTGET
jgi:hypothetical protein